MHPIVSTLCDCPAFAFAAANTWYIFPSPLGHYHCDVVTNHHCYMQNTLKSLHTLIKNAIHKLKFYFWSTLFHSGLLLSYWQFLYIYFSIRSWSLATSLVDSMLPEIIIWPQNPFAKFRSTFVVDICKSCSFFIPLP